MLYRIKDEYNETIINLNYVVHVNLLTTKNESILVFKMSDGTCETEHFGYYDDAINALDYIAKKRTI